MGLCASPPRSPVEYHRNCSFQLNPPHVLSEAGTYSNVSSDITSITGHATTVLKQHGNYNRHAQFIYINKNPTMQSLDLNLQVSEMQVPARTRRARRNPGFVDTKSRSKFPSNGFRRFYSPSSKNNLTQNAHKFIEPSLHFLTYPHQSSQATAPATRWSLRCVRPGRSSWGPWPVWPREDEP